MVGYFSSRFYGKMGLQFVILLVKNVLKSTSIYLIFGEIQLYWIDRDFLTLVESLYGNHSSCNRDEIILH